MCLPIIEGGSLSHSQTKLIQVLIEEGSLRIMTNNTPPSYRGKLCLIFFK